MPQQAFTVYTRLRLLMAAATLAVSMTAAGASDYATTSALAEGRWVKMRVDSTGVYRLSAATLRTLGFDRPEDVKVAGYGSVERAHTLDTGADDLPAVPVMRVGDDIYFFAEGPDRLTDRGSMSQPVEHRNYYSRSSYYFITDRDDFPSPEVREPVPDDYVSDDEEEEEEEEEPDTVTTHIVTLRHRFFEYHPYSAGAFTFSHDIKGPSGDVTVAWDTPDATNTPMMLSYAYIGLPSETSGTVSPMWKVTGGTATQVSVKGIRGTSSDKTIYVPSDQQRLSLSGAAGHRVTFTLSDPADEFDMLALDHATLRYEAANRYRTGGGIWQLYYASHGAPVEVTGLPADAVVWDVSLPSEPLRLVTEAEADGTALFAANPRGEITSRVALFVPGDEVPEPVVEGPVATQDLHAIPEADMLIVTTEQAYPEALRLAEAHRSMQGLEVAVARITDVANEFSSGAWHPSAVRRMVRMMATRGLRHLLLMGNGWGMPLSAGEAFPPDAMVTYHTEYTDEDRSSARNHCTDLYFVYPLQRVGARVTEPSVLYSINVGRAPVRNRAEARAFTDKCIAYLSDPRRAGHPGETLVFSGLGDANAHLLASMRVADIAESHLPGATVRHGSQALFGSERRGASYFSPRQEDYLHDVLGTNLRFINFSGHSTWATLGTEFDNALLNRTSFGSLPLFFTAGCLTGTFDTGRNSLIARMSVAEHGPIALIGTTREVYLDNNHKLNELFAERYFGATPDMTLGDIYTASINGSHSLASTSSVRDQVINNAAYHFFGDPALPVYAPSGGVTVTGVSAGTLMPALNPTTIEGRITTPGGATDTSFDGQLTAILFAPPVERAAASPDPTDVAAAPVTVTTDEEELAIAVCDVKAGRWKLTLTPPAATPGNVRIALSAFSADRRVAAGSCTSFVLTDTDAPALSDTNAPEIRLTLDGETDPVMTGSTPMLRVSMRDEESGICFARNAIGNIPTIKIDGTPAALGAQAFDGDAEGWLDIEFPLAPLSDGPHTVEVRASDIAGNHATATLDFIVETTPFEVGLEADGRIVREDVTLTLTGTVPPDTRTTLLVRDSNGDTVTRIAGATLPYTWDFTLPDGTRAADGTYRASALLKSDGRYASTPEVEFTIVKR